MCVCVYIYIYIYIYIYKQGTHYKLQANELKLKLEVPNYVLNSTPTVLL